MAAISCIFDTLYNLKHPILYLPFMREKLKCILLIDDNEADNFIHELIINESNCTEKVISVQGGQEGLDLLKNNCANNLQQPDLIFLDINMPGMSGWEFLEEYAKLGESQKCKLVLVMLTTSLNPDDENRASKINAIKGYINKPLSRESLKEVLDIHFS